MRNWLKFPRSTDTWLPVSLSVGGLDTQHIHNKKKTGKAQRASMAQEELQESKLTKAGGRKPTHGCNYPMVGWPSVILTPMGPSLNLTREGTSRPSLRSSLSLSWWSGIHYLWIHLMVCLIVLTLAALLRLPHLKCLCLGFRRTNCSPVLKATVFQCLVVLSGRVADGFADAWQTAADTSACSACNQPCGPRHHS